MKTRHFEVFDAGNQKLGVISHSCVLSNKLNQELLCYLKDDGAPMKIRKGEEAVFWISRNNIELFSTLIPKAYPRHHVVLKMNELLDQLEATGNTEENV